MDRRMAAREEHTAAMKALKDEGKMLIGAALLDDDGKMIGSSIIAEFEDQDALEEWLENEPYVKGDVWQEVNVTPCQLGAAFAKK